jgi:hypothetical protein
VIIVLTALGFGIFLAVIGVKRFLIPWHGSVVATIA